jgi:nucleoside-diphosphate-sugar epimerase
MMKQILLTGIDGYMGWPLALRLSKEFPDARIIGVDNFGRRKWVEEVGAVTAIPILGMEERLAVASGHGFSNIRFIEMDLTDRDEVFQLFDTFRFDVVVHAAAQPSAPYSQINGACANYTQYNNNQSARNLLWAIKEKGLQDDCHFIETTTTGVYGAPEFEIPEGFVTAENKGKKDTVLFPGMAGSWYHMSKSTDVSNLWLANRQWKLSISDLRTSIVYGTETEDTALDERLATRFDFDFYFGVVANRFCAMALTGHPITVYGKGGQKKPMISLEDAVESTVNAVRLDRTGEFRVYNQTTELVSIMHLATSIADAGKELGFDVEVKNIPNPRVEVEDHEMSMSTDNFRTLLPEPRYNLATGIAQVIKSLKPYKHVLEQYRDCFMG